MSLSQYLWDAVVFFGFIACVLFVGMFKSRAKKTADGKKEETGVEDYFLAGRGLSWWLIGFSLIAANISAEQFVGMSGQGAGVFGISCASWEWIAAITLVVVAFALLPYFLRAGITTIPEFLEVRYNHWARMIMTVSMMGILIVASLIGVTYAGGQVMKQFVNEIFGTNLTLGDCCWIMGLMAGAYVLFGGLKACAWADLLQGAALIVGGGLIAYFALTALGSADPATLTGFGSGTADAAAGAIERFNTLNAEKLIMGRPASDTDMPWTILLLGIWIPNFYYWGLNQYITQRILGSGSLAEGQKGLVFAAALKLLIPFIIVVPGIIAYNLFAGEMKQDAAQETSAVIEKIHAKKYDPNTIYIVADEVLATFSAEHQASVKAHNAPLLVKKSQGESVTEVTAQTYKYDSALGLLITKLIPKGRGIMGFVIAALLGAIVSSLAAVLNATSTLFAMDIYGRYINQKASQKQVVAIGRITIGVLMVVGCYAASQLNLATIFGYIQEVQCYVSPAILAVFVFGLINRTAARETGIIGLVVAPIIYAVMRYFHTELAFLGGSSATDLHFLNAASYTLIATLIIMAIYGAVKKMPEAVSFDSGKCKLDMTMSKVALIFGVVVTVATVALYVIFW